MDCSESKCTCRAVPPVGSDASQASRSSGWYRTSDPTFRNAGPRLSRRHLRSDATLTLSRFETSCSVMRLTMISPLSVECPSICKGTAEPPRDTNFAGARGYKPPSPDSAEKVQRLSTRKPAFAPHLIRKWREGVGTVKFRFSSMCNSLQTVCEQSATFRGRRSGVQQFVNKVQQIVISATRKRVSQTAKTP